MESAENMEKTGNEIPNYRYYLSGIIAIVFWGTTFAFAKTIVPDPLNPVIFITIRTFFGLIFLFSYIIVTNQIKNLIIIFKKHLKKFIQIGIFLYSMAYITQYYAITLTTATNQAIIANTQTFWVVILNFLILKRKPKTKFFIGLLLAFTGVTLIILRDGQGELGLHIVGDLLSVLAFIIWGGYTFTTKTISDDEKSLYITISILIFGALFLIPLSLTLGLSSQILRLNLNQWAVLIYLGIFCVGIGFILWTYALSNPKMGSENIAILTFLQPVVGVITSYYVLGEIIDINVVFGLIFVVFGLFVANWNFKCFKKKI